MFLAARCFFLLPGTRVQEEEVRWERTEVAAKVLDELYPVVLLLLPKLDVAILAGCDDEVRPEQRRKNRKNLRLTTNCCLFWVIVGCD